MTSYIGVDISRLTIDINFCEEGTYIKLDNNSKGYNKIKSIIVTLENKNGWTILDALEATGGYEGGLCEFLKRENIEYIHVNTIRMRSYARALGSFTKTDKIDARNI